MNKDTAKQVMERAYGCMRLIDEMVEVAMSHVDADELRVLRRAAGYTMSEMQDRLIDPVLREYPDLLPEGIEYTPHSGPTFTELAAKSRPAAPPGDPPRGNEP